MTDSIDRQNGPWMPDVGVIALVPDRWSAWWQPRHHVLTRLARYFQVVWVTPAPEWRGILRNERNQNSHGPDAIYPPGFIVYEPEFWLPRLYRPKWLAKLTFDARLKLARRLLIKRGCQKIVLYIWRPEFAPALGSIPFDLSCYHIDDEYSFSEVELPPDPAEINLIAKVDQVFIHSPGLLEKKGHINPHTVFVPNGVDYQAYARAVEEPRDLSVIPRPRIGYTGWIKKQLDWPLLLRLTERHPEWSFVFVGPQKPDREIFPMIEEISRRPNVYFLGAKSVEELAAYPQHFDICIMPYDASDDYAKYIYPLKLHEYLASGRPIVGSPIRSLHEFRHVTRLAQTTDEWSQAIKDSLAPAACSPDAVEARRSVARKHDWEKLGRQVASTLCDRLGPTYRERSEKLRPGMHRETDESMHFGKIGALDATSTKGSPEEREEVSNKPGTALIDLARNIVTTLGARIGVLAISLISSIVLARSLGPEGRGLFALILLLPELARSLSLLGFEQANAVYAGLQPASRRALVWQSAVLACVVGGVIAAACAWLLAIGAPGFRSLVHGPLFLYLLPLSMLPFRLVVEFWYSILRGMNRIFMLNLVEVGTKLVSLIVLVLFVVWLRLGVEGAVAMDFLMSLGSVILLVALLRHVAVWGKPVFDWPLWRRTAQFAIPAHGATIAGYINYRVDEFIIAMLLPPAQVGFYAIAVGVAERLWILTGAVANALLPHLTNDREHDVALAAVIARHVMLWTGAACLVLFAIAGVAVELLFSSAFVPAVAPLRWLLPGIFMLSVGRVLVAELLAREKPRYTVWASGIAALVNIAGNVVLIPRMGISGAALASSISYSFLSLIVTWYYFRETGVPWSILVPRRSDLLVYASLWRRPADIVSFREPHSPERGTNKPF